MLSVGHIRRIARKIKQYGDKCKYCSIQLGVHNFSIDHIIPVSKGGSNKQENKAAACQKCNKLKSDLPEAQFLEKFASRIQLAKRVNNHRPRWIPLSSPEPVKVKERLDWCY